MYLISQRVLYKSKVVKQSYSYKTLAKLARLANLLNVPNMYLFCTNVRKNLSKRIVGSEQILKVTLVEFIIADKENP